jgi:hypothetical protein
MAGQKRIFAQDVPAIHVFLLLRGTLRKAHPTKASAYPIEFSRFVEFARFAQ